MLNIKRSQETLVSDLLNSATHGPVAAEDFAYQPHRQVSLAHVGLVMDQLVIAGCMTEVEEGRYLTSTQGERMISLLETDM